MASILKECNIKKKILTYLPKNLPSFIHGRVFAELGKLKAAKSAGPDQIPPRLLKEFAYELSLPLTDILNNSFLEGKVPDQWKKGYCGSHPQTIPTQY